MKGHEMCEMKLKGKVAIVTGGARGIGREIALMLAREGANVAICDVNEESLQEARKDIEGLGREALGLKIDVTSLDQVEGMVQKVLDKWGKIDILINNAGITRDGLLLRMKEADWDAVLSVNLKGTFNCTKAATKVMMKQRCGKVVNIASIIGRMGNKGQCNYAASKGGVISFTKSIAKELASRNINVNAIAPGFIKTAMTAKLSDESQQTMLRLIPLNRFGEPEDVAKAALFLVSEESSYLTGQVITVDGGMVM